MVYEWITFFDLKESELDYFEIKQMSPFCHYYRTTDSGFEQKCTECDCKHLLIAKRTKNVHVYHCHSGLLEGSERGAVISGLGVTSDRGATIKGDIDTSSNRFASITGQPTPVFSLIQKSVCTSSFKQTNTSSYTRFFQNILAISYKTNKTNC